MRWVQGGGVGGGGVVTILGWLVNIRSIQELEVGRRWVGSDISCFKP